MERVPPLCETMYLPSILPTGISVYDTFNDCRLFFTTTLTSNGMWSSLNSSTTLEK